MNYSFHAGAEQDVTSAQDFYEQHAGLQVATRFLDELQHVIQLLLHHPGLGTPTTKKHRVFPLKAFPYSVVYLVVETKGYDNYADIPTKEKWKIDSAKQFFKALQELPDLKEKGVQIHYQSKINGESLAQLISGIK